MAHVFISYSKQDIDFARHLRRLLAAQGFSVWLDESRLAPSSRWWTEIESNIERSAALLVIMSPHARDSDWVEREILYAERLDKPIFPVLLTGEDWPRLANLQYADMRDGLNATLPPNLVARLAAVTGPLTRQSADITPPPSVRPPKRAPHTRPRRPSRWLLRRVFVLLAVIALVVAFEGPLNEWLSSDDDVGGGKQEEFDGGDYGGGEEDFTGELLVNIVEPPYGAEIPIHEEFVIGIEVLGVTHPMALVVWFDDQLVDERMIGEPEHMEWLTFAIPEPGPHGIHAELIDREPVAEDGIEVFGFVP